MSFFDKINPFKKKDDLGLPPLDAHGPPALTQDPLNNRQQLPSTPAGMPATHTTPGIKTAPHLEPRSEPMNDHRMKMPLGESIRQTRISAMHQGEYQPIEHHNPLKKDLELISSKLDYLKASLDSINQRLVNIEKSEKRW